VHKVLVADANQRVDPEPERERESHPHSRRDALRNSRRVVRREQRCSNPILL
jgi:hypothetical protein